MKSVNLTDILDEYPPAGLKFLRVELSDEESAPIGVVWCQELPGGPERGARIDLQKQTFLDDFGSYDRAKLGPAARTIVSHLRRKAGRGVPSAQTAFK